MSNRAFSLLILWFILCQAIVTCSPKLDEHITIIHKLNGIEPIPETTTEIKINHHYGV